MPAILKVETATTEVRLRRALQAVMRKLGMIGKVSPGDESLLRLAASFVDCRPKMVVDDLGRPVNFKECLAPPSAIDESIPF